MADNIKVRDGDNTAVILRATESDGVKTPHTIVTGLPSGLATSSAQTTTNNWLSTISEKLPALDSGKVPVAVSGFSPGTGPTDFGKAEDSVHSSGDVGVMTLFVRQDSVTEESTSNNGDYSSGRVNKYGHQYVESAGISLFGDTVMNAVALSGSPTTSPSILIARVSVAFICLQVSGAALSALSVEGQGHASDPWVTILSGSQFTDSPPPWPLLRASGALSTAGVGNHWMALDVGGLRELRLVATGAGATLTVRFGSNT